VKDRQKRGARLQLFQTDLRRFPPHDSHSTAEAWLLPAMEGEERTQRVRDLQKADSQKCGNGLAENLRPLHPLNQLVVGSIPTSPINIFTRLAAWFADRGGIKRTVRPSFLSSLPQWWAAAQAFILTRQVPVSRRTPAADR
jgi:hypothetical protein